ncbi:MAG TPA: ribosomal protein S18-alanine N-acetyltransferase [Desulfuromonadaceae bacterium]|jgi:ribosomal-protein-alanine N-acetyltransferase
MSEPGKIIIRPMEEPDLAEVLRIEQASFSSPWKQEHFLHEIASKHSFPLVAVREAEILGYVCIMSLFEEAQILDIAVAPEQRGRGLAMILMEHAFKTAREQKAEFMALEVRASNVAAICLYERIGFQRTGIRQAYYEGKEDAVLMEKNLLC